MFGAAGGFSFCCLGFFSSQELKMEKQFPHIFLLGILSFNPNLSEDFSLPKDSFF